MKLIKRLSPINITIKSIYLILPIILLHLIHLIKVFWYEVLLSHTSNSHSLHLEIKQSKGKPLLINFDHEKPCILDFPSCRSSNFFLRRVLMGEFKSKSFSFPYFLISVLPITHYRLRLLP